MNKPKLITSFSESNLEEILSRIILNEKIDKRLYENLDDLKNVVPHITTEEREAFVIGFGGWQNGSKIFNIDLKMYQQLKNNEWVEWIVE